MANEVVARNERVILVQVNKSTLEERVLYQDRYSGGFQPSSTVYNAKGYKDKESAQKIADTLNMLYNMTGQNFEVHVVNELIERTYLDEPPVKHDDAPVDDYGQSADAYNYQ